MPLTIIQAKLANGDDILRKHEPGWDHRQGILAAADCSPVSPTSEARGSTKIIDLCTGRDEGSL